MTTNLSYNDDIRYEILNVEIVYMPPSVTVNHNTVIGNIHHVFRTNLKGKKCRAFVDGLDVHMTEKDTVIPDIFIVCNHNIIKTDAIYGTPDLIVEVLTPSTATKDCGYKIDLYERMGVLEYWIVNTSDKSIEVYLLKNEKLVLDKVHVIYPEHMFSKLSDKEKDKISYDFKVSIFDDLNVSLNEIFENI